MNFDLIAKKAHVGLKAAMLDELRGRRTTDLQFRLTKLVRVARDEDLKATQDLIAELERIGWRL